MLRKLRLFPDKHALVVPGTVALIGLACLAILASNLHVVQGGSGSKINTVTQPYAEALEPPTPTSVAGTNVPGGDAPDDPVQEISQSVSCEDLLLMVGPDHTLTADYVPPYLVYLSTYGIWARGAEDMLREEAAVQLASLVSDAAEDGVEVLVASGYRSYWEQNGTFEWFKNEYGEDAGKLSVPPGQSEHQLGTAVDFASSDTNYELVPEFAQTSAGVWLDEHAAQYGFILSYRKNQEDITGVNYEPWHYRYIGIENALQAEATGESPMALYHDGASLCYES